jgi:hypothetical protein
MSRLRTGRPDWALKPFRLRDAFTLLACNL